MAARRSRILIGVLIGVLAVTLLLCVGGVELGGWFWSRAVVDIAGRVEFVNPLAVPPLAESRVDSEGRRVFDLRAQASSRDFGEGDDDRASSLALPRRYGVDDFPVIVQDRNFDRGGQFDDRPGFGGIGILGDTLLVNGTVGPTST